MNAKRTLQLVISLVIGGVFLWLAFSDVDLTEAGHAASLVPWYGHALYALALVVQFLVRTERWSIQAHGISGTKPAFREALGLNMVAFAAVFFVPFRLGEFVRPYLCRERGIMTMSAGLATSALERVMDGIVTTGFLGVVLFLMRDQDVPRTISLGGYVALAFFGIAMVVLVLAYRWRVQSAAFWNRVISLVHTGLARKLVGILNAFLDGLDCFRTRRDLVFYILLTIAFWGINGAGLYVLLQMLGVPGGALAAYFTLCVLVVGMMIPAPPANVGNFEFAITIALGVFGATASLAAAFAIMVHLWQMLALLVGAGFFLAIGDVSFARLREATHSTGADAESA
jgi:uncharacterized protein (TIRG00374 family)